MSKGLLTVLSGFSGAGKGTLMARLLEKYDGYALSISATTRSPRPGEQEGVHYFYRTEEEFLQMIREDALLEHACYVGNYYGTPAAYVDRMLEEGKDVILEIEIQGALKVKAKRPDTILIFVTPPSADELEKRLTGRGTETPEVIAGRLKRAVEESEGMDKYDYILVNDDLEECVDRLHSLIRAQHDRACFQGDFITAIRRELAEREEKKA